MPSIRCTFRGGSERIDDDEGDDGVVSGAGLFARTALLTGVSETWSAATRKEVLVDPFACENGHGLREHFATSGQSTPEKRPSVENIAREESGGLRGTRACTRLSASLIKQLDASVGLRRWLTEILGLMLRASLRKAMTHPAATMAAATRVLECSSASIAFDAAENVAVHDKHTLSALTEAASVITDGRCVAFPTETVYGLGANALDPAAVQKIFSTKGRPSDNPLIVHVSSRAMLRSLLPQNYAVPPTYETLMRAFWPGPLTLLFPSASHIVPKEVTAGHATVGIRMPAHPVARALIALADRPVAAPSANSSGKPSPTKASHVFKDLAGRVPIVLDGGACDVGVESTVLDGLHSDGVLRILRPGGVSVESIQRVLGPDGPRVLVHRKDFVDKEIEAAPTTPGMKYTHYSPSVPVILLRSSKDGSVPAFTKVETLDAILASVLPSSPQRHLVGIMALSDSPISSSLPPSVNWLRFDMGASTSPAVAARRLFDGLLTLDAQGVAVILVEAVSETHEGLAVMNRLSKAASQTRWIAA